MRIAFRIVLLALSLCISVAAVAQSKERGWMQWTSAQQEYSGLQKFKVQVQLHHRWFSGGTHHWIAPRINGIFAFKERWSLNGGIANFGMVAVAPDQSAVVQTEIRPHQGLGYHFEIGKAHFSQQVTVEERTFLSAGDGRGERLFIRLRYRSSFSLSFGSRKVRNWRFECFNEVMFNAAHSHTQRAFDQNRIFAGITYHFNHQLAMNLGYMYWIQQPISSRSIVHFDVIRLGVMHSLSLNPQ